MVSADRVGVAHLTDGGDRFSNLALRLGARQLRAGLPRDRRFSRLRGRGRGARQRRALEHMQAAAAVAFETDKTLTLAGPQQVHQAAKSIATLVEERVGSA